jgi:hypothetical protein
MEPVPSGSNPQRSIQAGLGATHLTGNHRSTHNRESDNAETGDCSLLQPDHVVAEQTRRERHHHVALVFAGVAKTPCRSHPDSHHEKRRMFAEILERLRRAACIQIRRACRQKPRRWIALWQMLVPIAAPSILTTSVLNFLFCWNEFLFALILTSQNALTFLPSLLRYELPRGPLYGQIFAGSTIFLLPPLFALFLIRRHFSTGFGMGAVR